jgi:hypothetical protein
MKECWSEGELRAYLDRELPPGELERAAAHLRQCAACERTFEALAARAGRLAVLLDELATAGPAMPLRAGPSHRRRWAAAVLALAAGLAIAAALLPRRSAPLAPVPPAAAVASIGPAPVAREVLAQPLAAPAPARRPAPRTRLAERNDAFVRLDDEPFEAGVVLRVALGPNEVPADVVFGSDGRAHAIRLVNFK